MVLITVKKKHGVDMDSSDAFAQTASTFERAGISIVKTETLEDRIMFQVDPQTPIGTLLKAVKKEADGPYQIDVEFT